MGLVAQKGIWDSVVADWLLIVTPIVGFCICSMFRCALLCVHSSFAFKRAGCFA